MADKAKGSAQNNVSGDMMMLGDDISMNRIIDFLKEQQRTNFSRETDFVFEK